MRGITRSSGGIIIASAIGLLLIIVEPSSGQMSNTYHQFCVDRRQCSEHLLEHCDPSDQCECRPNAQFDPATRSCRPCPDTGVLCAECCTAFGHQCLAGLCVNCYEYGNNNRCWPELTHDATPSPPQPPSTAVIYITASQIALSAALIMGSVALITLMYRICSKPATSNGNHGRYGRRAQPSAGARCARGGGVGGLPHDAVVGLSPTAFQRLSQRMSLTSMQARVLSRLRDQPPKYESQHHYDTRMQQTSASVGSGGEVGGAGDAALVGGAAPVEGVRTVSVRMPDESARGHGLGTAPPCYDNDAYSLSDLPPPYTAETVRDDSSAGRRGSATVPAPNLPLSEPSIIK